MKYNVAHMEHSIDLNLLRIFHLVAAKGSLTQAALFLNTPKSKISRNLTKLEEQLQTTLLNRSPRGIQLTSEGKVLLERTQGALELLSQGIKYFQNTEEDIVKGEITLTAPEDITIEILPQLIAHFNDLYPEIAINIYNTNDRLSFDRFNIDLALRIGKLPDSNLIQKKISDIHLIKVKASANPRYSASLYDLNAQPLIEHDGNEMITIKSNSFLYLKALTLQSSMESVLPEFICRKELQNKELISIPYHSKVKNKGLYLLSRPHSFVPKHVKTFKDYLYQELKILLD